uniref:Centrosomal protein 112 n=1 Tax=Molossus molossus TaxID=27622 RepID=A0A7J8CX53_MOLMO|nr:centrosomal protein 112 [Molossus molossus]
MWTPLTLDYSSPKESQAPGLTRIKGGNGNGPETQQAGSLRPLRDTGPSGLKEKMANSRLKQIEKEYTQKLAKSSQTIAELQTAISSLKEESSRQQLAAERRLQDVTQKFEDEKKQLIRDNDRAIKALHSELENRANQVRCAEKKLQHKELEAQEQVPTPPPAACSCPFATARSSCVSCFHWDALAARNRTLPSELARTTKRRITSHAQPGMSDPWPEDQGYQNQPRPWGSASGKRRSRREGRGTSACSQQSLSRRCFTTGGQRIETSLVCFELEFSPL